MSKQEMVATENKIRKPKPTLRISSKDVSGLDNMTLNDDVVIIAKGKIKTLSAPDEWDDKYNCTIELSETKIKSI